MRKVRPSNKKIDFRGVTLDIELLVINIVQGFAIVALAESAFDPLNNLQFEYWPYIITGLLITFIFWSQSVMHALSFIEWPIDFIHSFLYFIAGIFEVLLFQHITTPQQWFLFSIFFFIVALIIYLYDLRLIDYFRPQLKKSLFIHIKSGQMRDLYIFVIPGFVFNIGVYIFAFFYTDLFIKQHYHLVFIVMQAIFSIVMLTNSLKAFEARSNLLSS